MIPHCRQAPGSRGPGGNKSGGVQQPPRFFFYGPCKTIKMCRKCCDFNAGCKDSTCSTPACRLVFFFCFHFIFFFWGGGLVSLGEEQHSAWSDGVRTLFSTCQHPQSNTRSPGPLDVLIIISFRSTPMRGGGSSVGNFTISARTALGKHPKRPHVWVDQETPLLQDLTRANCLQNEDD